LIKYALGMIEIVGLAAAIEAADTALKTANVELLGYEFSKGGGLVVVKIQGDVSAVNSAIKSAIVSAEKVNKVFSTTIIARPDEKLYKMVLTDETVGIEKSDYSNEKENQEEQNVESAENLLNDNSSNAEGIEQSLIIEELLDSKDEENNEDIEKRKSTCNICMDPKCSRKKGEPKNICIHHN